MKIGSRFFDTVRKRKDKEVETASSVRNKMRQLTRLYLAFKDELDKQTGQLEDSLGNSADMFRRETTVVLGGAIECLCSPEVGAKVDQKQKSGLKLMLQNNLKTSAKYLNGYFLINNVEVKSKRVIDFMAVFKMVENEMFGDAIYDLNNRRNVKLKKPSYLPNQKDVNRIVEYCKSTIKNKDTFGTPITSNVDTPRFNTHTWLLLFNGRRGGEPARLLISQLEEVC